MIRALADAGVHTGVLTAPIIPALNDHELERMLAAAAERGAKSAGYVLLRLPHEVAGLFVEWLNAHYPDRAEHIQSLIRQMRGGALNDATFHSRQHGHGPFAALLKTRFERAKRLHGLDREVTLCTSLFAPPRGSRPQLDLWPEATSRESE
jgi:DNA repair photolyase